jgi:hypothetical protein
MDFQTKLFRWPDRGNYVIMIARGQTNISGFQQMFQKLAEIHEALVDWRVLIDLFDVRFGLEPAGVDAFASGLRAARFPENYKIALVGAPEIGQYDQLCMLSASLCKQGFRVAAFDDSKLALDWLAANP